MKIKKLDKEDKVNLLLGLYKVSDENHKFYVDKRFTIISLYFPLITTILSGIYFFINSNFRILTCILGLALTLFLYNLEKRNWILSNICLSDCRELGERINGIDNLHIKLSESYHSKLPISYTFLDKLFRKFVNSQHKSVAILTIFLILYWLVLIAIPFIFHF